MLDPTRLSIVRTGGDGEKRRWGGDEYDAANVPSGISFSTSLSAGFRDFGCKLTRRPDVPWYDLDRFDRLEVVGAGGELAWQGRAAEFPRQTGAEFSIDVSGVGYSAHLLDDPSFTEIYIDRDPSRWTEAGDARRLLVESNDNPIVNGPQVVPRDAGAALLLQIEGAWVAPHRPRAEAWYHAPAANKVARILASFEGDTSDLAFVLGCHFTDQEAALDETGADAYTAQTGSIDRSPTTPRRRAAFHWTYSSTPAGADGSSYGLYLRDLLAIGSHLVPLVGNPYGVLADDVIRDVLARAAPQIKAGQIDGTLFPIPHLVFADPVNASDVIEAVNAYHLRDWGVYEGPDREPALFWREAENYRRRWVIRLDEGGSLDLAGETAEASYNGVLVAFTDPAGVQRTAGPISSGADYQDDSLIDTSENNPVNSHGIHRRWGRLDLSFTATAESAIQLGRIWLQEMSKVSHRGAISATGYVRDRETGGRYPAWMVRAGDSVTVPDYDGIERRIVDTSYQHDSLGLSASLDSLPHRLDAIMQRAGIALVGIE